MRPRRRAHHACALVSTFVATLSAATHVPAQQRPGDRTADGQPLTLEEAARRALASHPSVAVSEAGRRRASANAAGARSGLFPSLSVDANATRFEQPMIVAPLHGLDLQSPPLFGRTLVQGNLALGYLLFDGGARGARIEQSRALIDVADARIDATRQDLLARVANAYLAVATQRDVLDANRARVEALESEGARAARLVESGRAARLVALRAEAALSRAVADAAAALARLRSDEAALWRLIGTGADSLSAWRLEPLGPMGSSSVPERGVALEAAKRASGAVVTAKARLMAAEAGKGVARAAFLPTVRLAGRYNGFGSAAGDFVAEWQTGVQVSYPIFTGGARASELGRAEADVDEARASVAIAELQVEDGVERALAALADADARVDALVAAEAQYVEVVGVERLAIEAGAGVQTDYLGAESQLLETRATLAQARAARIGARIELARLTGELSLDALSNIVEAGS
jgi:outer membrane protein